jgi:NADPH-dependent 2,4-dienoyl-CoA reductase/sulfur reductase-like enzyme
MRLVVIGGVAAGLSAASRARRLDPSLDVVVLEKSRHVCYGACGLPYFIEGRVRRLDQLTVYTPQWLEQERGIGIRTDAEVLSISHPRREIALRGEKVRYDKLVLATGARRDLALIHGSAESHVHRLDTWDDAAALSEFLKNRRPSNAAIAGAGYIGLEAAEALRSQGLAVTVYEAAADVLGREDPWLTARIRAHLQRCRVELRLGSPLSAIPRADVVVLACGLKPNVDLAADAGVEIGRTGAIRVTERMETNLHGVYASGDCAEAVHLVSGRPVWFPLGTTANKMGRVAGACAAGRRERFAGIVGTSIVRVCGLGVGVTGLSPSQARREGFDPVSSSIDGLDKAPYFRGHSTAVTLTADRRTGRLLGAAILGEDGVAGRVNVVAMALHHRSTIEEFEALDLAYAPPFSTVWDPLLIAAHELRKLLH